jgi:hypothetical protein
MVFNDKKNEWAAIFCFSVAAAIDNQIFWLKSAVEEMRCAC